MKTTALIALFCAAGGVARYVLSGWVYALLGRAFPWGTLAVNVIGAYLVGLVMAFGLRGTALPESLRVGLTVGFLGGLTTFSTFSYETFRLLEEGQFVPALANALGSVVACLLFTWLGMVTARAMA
jgi:CrcB protein